MFVCLKYCICVFNAILLYIVKHQVYLCNVLKSVCKVLKSVVRFLNVTNTFRYVFESRVTLQNIKWNHYKLSEFGFFYLKLIVFQVQTCYMV